MPKDNSEKRSSSRFDHKAKITLERFEVGVIQEARMHNYSKSGVYFESDFYLVPGAEIYIGISSSPFAAEPGVYECYRSVVKWRKFLEHSAFDYGYGIELKGKAARPEKAAGGGSPACIRAGLVRFPPSSRAAVAGCAASSATRATAVCSSAAPRRFPRGSVCS